MASTKKEIIEELKQLLEQDVTVVREQVEHLKTQFYSKGEPSEPLEEEPVELVEGEVSEAPAEGEEAAEPKEDSLEAEFKELLAQYKAKRAELAAEQTKEQEANLARKEAIIEQMAKMVENGSAEEVMANLQKMRELQAEWKTIGPVPAPHVQQIRKDYQRYQEQFYDLVKINIELRDLDFKKNLEAKTLLCEAAERLQNNDNIVEASRSLQQLHDEWAEIGPVARELREDLWNRFKAASTIINKKHQAYFDALHAKEKENLERKQALIEQLKEIVSPIQNEEKLSAKQWEQAAERVQTIQTEWRKIGFAPKKQNQAIYDEYRGLCDTFFHAKAAYYKGIRDTFSENLKQKRSLLDRAKSIVEGINVESDGNDSVKIEWNKAAEELRELQAEWKTVGPVARKYSEDIWKQFTDTCDSFFNSMREATKKEKIERSKEKVAKAVKAGGESLYRLRDRLQQEIKVAENNILFFTAKSKTANKLVDSMQQKINALKKQLEDIKEKIDKEEE